ncbi:MAG: putative S-layer protein [Candidatus Pacearchaeota archaeon]
MIILKIGQTLKMGKKLMTRAERARAARAVRAASLSGFGAFTFAIIFFAVILAISFASAFDYCSANSTQNYLSVSIYNDDDFEGKDFEPYDKIAIEVKIKNDDSDDHDVVVSAVLVSDNETIEDSEVEEEINVNEDSSKTITLTIKIPVIDEGSYDVYVKAYDDDNKNECAQDSSYIDVERPTKKIKVLNAGFDKSLYACSETAVLSGVIANIGENDEDQVKLAYSDDLGNIAESIIYDLSEGDENNFLFNIAIPSNASEKQHTATLKIYYDYRSGSYNRFDTYNYYFTISGGCIKPVKDVSLSLSLPTSMQLNEEYNGNLFLINTGNLDATYMLELEGDWASINLETGLVSLKVNEQRLVSFTIKPLKEGSHLLTAKAKFDGKEKSATKSVKVEKVESVMTGGYEKYKKASWWDELKFEAERHPIALAIFIASIIIAVVSLIGIIIVLRSRY